MSTRARLYLCGMVTACFLAMVIHTIQDYSEVKQSFSSFAIFFLVAYVVNVIIFGCKTIQAARQLYKHTTLQTAEQATSARLAKTLDEKDAQPYWQEAREGLKTVSTLYATLQKSESSAEVKVAADTEVRKLLDVAETYRRQSDLGTLPDIEMKEDYQLLVKAIKGTAAYLVQQISVSEMPAMDRFREQAFGLAAHSEVDERG